MISAAIGTVERDGGVKAAHEAVFSSPDGSAQMIAAHASYASQRWALLNDEERELVESKGWTHNLKTVGIAGIREPLTVKCLHTHFAHWLADPTRENAIGAWVYEALPPDVQAFALPEGLRHVL